MNFDQRMIGGLCLFTSPRLRGEVGSLSAIRVRGAIRESSFAVSSPHPNPLPAGGERELLQSRSVRRAE